MKKVLAFIIGLAIVFAAGAGIYSAVKNGEKESEKEFYTITYRLDDTVRTLQVKRGESYYLDSVPRKNGYIFKGLFDREEGGTQFVTASGNSVVPFSDKKDLILFPQFEGEEYTLVLDYGDAEYVADRRISCRYGETLPQLPADLTSKTEGFAFDGWFADRTGSEKVADSNGSSSKKVDKLTANGDKEIYLYAVFRIKTFTVNFYEYNESYDSWSRVGRAENVEYDTSVSKILPERTKNGAKIVKWSTDENGETYVDTIRDDLDFYAYKYEVNVTVDYANGTSPTVIKTTNRDYPNITTPSRKTYEFTGWKDQNGNDVNDMIFSEDVKLTAKWLKIENIITFKYPGVKDRKMTVSVGGSFTVPGIEIFEDDAEYLQEFGENIFWTSGYESYEAGEYVTPQDDLMLTMVANDLNVSVFDLDCGVKNISTGNATVQVIKGVTGNEYSEITVSIAESESPLTIYLCDADISGGTSRGLIYLPDGVSRNITIISIGNANSLKNTAGGSAVNVKNLTVAGSASLTLYGSDGGVNQNGGDGIVGENVNVTNGVNLTVYGGRGGRGSDGGDCGNGNIGGKGGVCVRCKDLVVENGATMNLYGGKGGDGGNGLIGYNGGSGANGTDNKATDGAGGSTGGKGGDGGRGGYSGEGINADNVSFMTESIFIYLCSDGAGGNGGEGGRGGNGGSAGSQNVRNWIGVVKGSKSGTGGRGGNGGEGGKGGNSGYTAAPIVCKTTSTSTALANIVKKVVLNMNLSSPGKGGRGGNGGNGGNSGQSHVWGMAEQFAGAEGSGGKGGKTGDYEYIQTVEKLLGEDFGKLSEAFPSDAASGGNRGTPGRYVIKVGTSDDCYRTKGTSSPQTGSSGDNGNLVCVDR